MTMAIDFRALNIGDAIPAPTTRGIRPVRIEGDIAYVTLTKGYVAIIDAADVCMVRQWNWTASEAKRADGTIRAVYAVRSQWIDGHKAQIPLHRWLNGNPADMDVDHRDGDGLNNRRSNLRHATRSQNLQNQRRGQRNTSGFKGVVWDESRRKWAARIVADGRNIHIGRFAEKTQAAAAYAEASKRLHGDFGRIE